ncbi:MAG: DNA polymerase Y family protein, partial [Ilumatobacteraceae bacterium]
MSRRGSAAGGPPRLAVLWCPHWSVVAAGAEPDEAVAVLHAMRVVARSRVAGDAGVEVGMRRREAQSRCPHVRLETHHPDRDARAFERVVRAVAERVPRLECTEPGTLVFASRGPSRYFGGDAAMAALVAADAAAAIGPGLAAVNRVAAASTAEPTGGGSLGVGVG